MNFKNNLELSIYLRSFGIFDTKIFLKPLQEILTKKLKFITLIILMIVLFMTK